MALPRYVHARAALAAPIHAQLSLERIELPSATPGDASVVGRFVRIFRGPPDLLGQEARVEVPVCREGDAVPPSGVLWTRVEALEAARVLEVFLAPHGRGYQLVSWQSATLPGTTEAPAIIYSVEDVEPPEAPEGTTALVRGVAWSVFALLFVGGGLLGLGYALWTLLR